MELQVGLGEGGAVGRAVCHAQERVLHLLDVLIGGAHGRQARGLGLDQLAQLLEILKKCVVDGIGGVPTQDVGVQ